ncbi:MAG TPA: hypothetical protein VFR01_09670 [Geobacterales bacterium]|nr:hypothetical protein [Geobacterales bacterium]
MIPALCRFFLVVAPFTLLLLALSLSRVKSARRRSAIQRTMAGWHKPFQVIARFGGPFW